jgi:hypothetical protein
MSDTRNESRATGPSEVVNLLTEHFTAANESWRRIAKALREEIASSDDRAFLANTPATKFILSWMREWHQFQKQFGELFARRKRPHAGDEFTAAIALSLEQFLAARTITGRIRSEEKTHKKRGATRPDISICSLCNKLVATIECKTQLGYKRKDWKVAFEQRTEELGKLFPACSPFLCVLTSENWDFSVFEKSPLYNRQWFCLSSVSQGRISDPVAESEVLTPIEPMFLQILKKLSAVNRSDIDESLAQLSAEEQEQVRCGLEE